jgi:hypothetical protein
VLLLIALIILISLLTAILAPIEIILDDVATLNLVLLPSTYTDVAATFTKPDSVF